MMIGRRRLLGGLAMLAAPAIIRTPGLLMPIKPIRHVRGLSFVSETPWPVMGMCAVGPRSLLVPPESVGGFSRCAMNFTDSALTVIWGSRVGDVARLNADGTTSIIPFCNRFFDFSSVGDPTSWDVGSVSV